MIGGSQIGGAQIGGAGGQSLVAAEAALVAPLTLPVEQTLAGVLTLPVESALVARCGFLSITEASWTAPLPLGVVETSWSARLPLPVEASLTAPCGLSTIADASLVAPLPLGVVETLWTARLPLPVEASLTAPCGLASIAEAQLVAPLPLGVVETLWTAPLPLPVEAELVAPCGLATIAEASLVAPLPLGVVETLWTARLALPVEASLTAPCGLRTITEAALVAPLWLLETAEAALVAPLPLPAAAVAERALGVPLPLLSRETEVLTGSARVVLAGQPAIAVSAASVTADEGSPYWQAEIELADPDDYARLALDTLLTLELFGSSWALVVRGRELRRAVDAEGNERPEARVTALSPVWRYSSEVAAGLTQTWSAPVGARAAVEALLAQSVAWSLVDWTIPAYRLAALDAAPLEVAQRVVAAAGGELESLPDGSLIARSRWPVAAPALAAASADETLVERRVFSLAEQGIRTRPMNRVRVLDIEASFRDQLEFEADEADGWKGLVKAWPAPWRPVRVVHTRGAPLALYALGEVVEQHTETVEFIAGRAALRYPLNTLVSVTWLAIDPGGVAGATGSRDLVASDPDAYTLALVTYTSRALHYRAEASMDLDAQFLLEDLSRG